MNDLQPKFPQLLVSVRNAAEALVALDGGCDVLDVKEPSRGPLGMADETTIAAILDGAKEHDRPAPVSVALGEAAEWSADRPPPQLPRGIAFLKLGTAHLPSSSAGASRFSDALRRFENVYTPDFRSDSPHACGFATPPRWIAVAYADFELACGPAPEEVAELASTWGCAGLLIDTFSKQQKRLLDWLDDARLAALAIRCRSLGLTFALAGRLQACDLPRILEPSPDIIGIRSAACRAGQRDGPVDAAALREFRQALQSAVGGKRCVDFSVPT